MVTKREHIFADSKVFHIVYDSWHEFVSDASSYTFDGAASELDDIVQTEWSGGLSKTDAIFMAKKGWRDGALAAESVINSLIVNTDGIERRKILGFSYVGPGVSDFHRLSIGHPESWTVWNESSHLSNSAGKFISVYINMGVSHQMNSEEYRRKGVVTAAMTDILEMTGHRVEIIGYSASQKGFKHRVVMLIPLKDFNDSLNLSRLTFAIGHISCLRRLVFSVMEKLPDDWKEALDIVPIRGTYGSTVNLDELDEDETILHIPTYLGAFSSEIRQYEWMMNRLNKYGVNVVLPDKGYLEF